MNNDSQQTIPDRGGKQNDTPSSVPLPARETTVSPLRSVTVLQTTASVAAAFCVLICAVMLYQHFVATQRDPWKSPQLLALKEQLRAAPADVSLRSEIRALDLEFRRAYFRRLSLNQTAGWLLVAGVAVVLFASKRAAKLRQRLPQPRLDPEASTRARRSATQSRWSVAAVGGVALTGLVMLALSANSPPPASAQELDKLLGRTETARPVQDLPTLAEFRANWPRFRGFDGGGVAGFTNRLPVVLDDSSGKGILWKSQLPAIGVNSPIVWSNRIFAAGGYAEKREIFCFDLADGKLLWQRAIENVPGTPATQPALHEPPGFTGPTLACDSRRVFALFGNGDLVALTATGAPSWSKNIGVPKNNYGHAASLAVWPGKLIVQMDQEEGAPGGSKLLAFDCATGKLLWERRRAMAVSWPTPIVVEAAGKEQIITLGMPWIISYSPSDGSEIWRARLLEGEVTPSPIFAGEMVIAVNPMSELIALRPDGAADVTKSHMLWTADENMPDITSPVSNGELVFTVNGMGVLMCLDLKNGRKIWEHELQMDIQASPSIAAGVLYLASVKGDVVAVDVAREFKELGRSKLDDQFFASPAFADGKMILRGNKYLWCVGGTSP